MADGDQQQEQPISRPVVEDAKAKIASLNKIAARMQRHIIDLEQRRCRTQHERRELAAVEDGILALEWLRASVDDQCEAERLLTSLVTAVRSASAASTSAEREIARAAVEEAMGHAGPWADDRD